MAAMGHAQQNMSIYGYLDFTLAKTTAAESNNLLFQQPFLTEDIEMDVGDINLYFDFTPNEYTRALVEVNFGNSPGDDDRIIGVTNGIVDFESTGVAPIDGSIGVIGPIINQSAGTVEIVAPKSEKKYYGVEIERAWVDVSLSDEYTLKAGKFITPAGIWAVDHGSPVITTVSQPNQTDFFPIFPRRQTGLMLTGNHFVGDHDIELKAFVSTGRDADNVINEIDDLGYGGKLGLNLDMLDGVHFGVSGFGGTIKRESRTYNINQLVPADDLLAMASDPAVAADPTGMALAGAIGAYLAADEPNLGLADYTLKSTRKQYDVAYGAEMKIEESGFTLQGEINGRKLIDEQNNDAEMTYLAWYGLLSYTSFLTENVSVTPYGFVETITWEDPENDPYGGLTSIPMDGWTQYATGLNFGFFNNYRLKLEYAYSNLHVNKEFHEASTIEEGDLDLASYSAQITVAF